MKCFSLFLLIVLFCNSCDKKEEEVAYSYSFDLLGDLDSDFAKQGETRRFTLSIHRKPKVNGVFTGEQERVKASAISKIHLDVGQFSLLNIEKDNFICTFELQANPNEEDSIRKGSIMFSIADGTEFTSKTYVFQQRASQIEYQYAILTEMPQPFYIPMEGGKFEVPFICNRLKSVNGKQADTLPSVLKGLKYNFFCANSGVIHSVSIEKNAESTGKYKFVIGSLGKYNLTNWGLKNDSAVFIEIKDKEKVIFHCDIIQPQTEGEDFSVPLISSVSLGSFDI